MEPTSDGGPCLSCQQARELVSAAADDEIAAAERLRLADHLDRCPGCRRYSDRVASLTRRVRLQAVPAEFERSLDIVVRAMSHPPRLGRGGWLRPALAWCAVVVLAQSVRPLLLGEMAGTPTHVARHVGASAVALAIGLLYAAWRPQRAQGLLPLVGALLVTTSFGTVLDTLSGARRPGAELVHVAELAGTILVWLVAGSPGWERIHAPALRGRAFGRARSSS